MKHSVTNQNIKQVVYTADTDSKGEHVERRPLGAIHTKIDLSWIDLRSISVRFEKVFTLI